MRQREQSPLGLYTVGIAALFLAGFFLLVVLGARSYRQTVAGQEDNMRTRALLSYIATSVKAGDAAGAVTVRESEYGPALIVADGSGYAQRIYCCDGSLVEDYAAIDAPLAPERAQRIGETALFTAEKDGDLLRVRTDAGQLLLHLRAEGGDAP